MVLDAATKREREVAKLFTDPPPLFGAEPIKWSPDNKWIAYLSYSPETRSYTNAYVVSASGGNARPVSFLANSNSNTLAWSPDGTYLLFDTNQRTEDNFIARVDLTLRTPKFREDQFRDLFKQENPRDRQPHQRGARGIGRRRGRVVAAGRRRRPARARDGRPRKAGNVLAGAWAAASAGSAHAG